MNTFRPDEVIALLGQVWPRLPAAVEQAHGWGAEWFECSTPFVAQVDGRIVAHVGVWPFEVVLAGERTTVAGIHAVCSDSRVRGRGHMRATLERALAWADQRFATAVLWANQPAIYERFGFRSIPESIFITSINPNLSTNPVRPLSLDDSADVELLRSALARRTPVSQQTGSVEPGGLALMDLALWSPGPSIAWIPELESIIVYAIRGRFLDLYDVIAERIPTLAQIASRLGPRLETAVVHFTPDQLDIGHCHVDSSVFADTLMVRGAWPSMTSPIAFAPITRC